MSESTRYATSKLVTSHEAAEMMGVSKSTISRWLVEGYISRVFLPRKDPRMKYGCEFMLAVDDLRANAPRPPRSSAAKWIAAYVDKHGDYPPGLDAYKAGKLTFHELRDQALRRTTAPVETWITSFCDTFGFPPPGYARYLAGELSLDGLRRHVMRLMDEFRKGVGDG